MLNKIFLCSQLCIIILLFEETKGNEEELTTIEFQCLQHKQQYSRARGTSLIQKRIRDSFKRFLVDLWWIFPESKRISAKGVRDFASEMPHAAE